MKRGNGNSRSCTPALFSYSYLHWSHAFWTFLQRVTSHVQDQYLGPAQLCACGSLRNLSMAEKELASLLKQIHQTFTNRDYQQSLALLTRAKLSLLSLNALVPVPGVSEAGLLLARETFELGALASIRRQDYDSFTRYFEQLQPFYDLPPSRLSGQHSNQSKVVGLHLLLLLSQGDYAAFHTVLESLEVAAAAAAGDGKKAPKGGKAVEDDPYIQYPVKLEQDLMEGAYDKVWAATKGERVPSEEYGVFSEVGTCTSEASPC